MWGKITGNACECIGYELTSSHLGIVIAVWPDTLAHQEADGVHSIIFNP